MRFNDAIIGVVLIVFAIAEIAYTRTFPRLHGQDFGPDLFPIVIGAGLIICGSLLIWGGLKGPVRAPLVMFGDWAQERGRLLDVALVPGALLAYILLSDPIGFVLVSFAILLVLLVRLGTGFITSALLAAATTLVVHALFAKLLLVPLPWGIMQPLAW